MNKYQIISTITAAFLVTLIATNSTFAFFGNHNNQNKNFDPERHEEMQEILENKNFEAFKALETERCQTRINEMTADKFNSMAEKKLEYINHMETMRNAMDSGDYNTWKAALENSPRGKKMLEIVTEENFDKLVESHKLMQAGDYEGAKAIKNELGLQKGLMKETSQRGEMRGGMKGMNRFDQ